MPSVVALRRWLVCVAGLRLISGSGFRPRECQTMVAHAPLTTGQLRSLHRLVPSDSATYEPFRSGWRLRCSFTAMCGLCKD